MQVFSASLFAVCEGCKTSLWKCLKEAYGMYDYFGDTVFSQARMNMEKRIADEYEYEYGFERSLAIVKEELAFIKDGHFYIGKPREYIIRYDYAVKYSVWEGIPMIDCKKFYYDNEDEKAQLEEFAKRAEKYQNAEPLILDLRDNEGGSTVYLFDFLTALLGCEPGYSLKCVQRNSELFQDYLRKEGIDWELSEAEEVQEEEHPLVENKKPIYVLFNEKSASAAEEGIAYLRNIENVTLVGNHSAGRASCGNCITIYLPNSHIQVHFGTGIVLYDGYRNIDAEGGFKGDISYTSFLQMLKERRAEQS